MCGIAGYWGALPFDPAPVFHALRHRGPDGQGYASEPVAGGKVLHLVHTRLKILDLSEAAAQPMSLWPETEGRDTPSSLPAGRRTTGTAGSIYTLVFNGEIYNFRELRAELVGRGWTFSSSGDTEVLLKGFAEWGPAVFRKCDGMFAAAVFDRRRQELVLARDHVGIKPLYIAQPKCGGLIFASEVRALLATGLLSGSVDAAAVADYLRLGSFQEPATIFADVRSFAAGTFCRIPLGSGTAQAGVTTAFWSPWEFVPEPSAFRRRSPQECEAEHAATLAATIEEQLVSDVPVGVFLSGGVDSTVILEHAVRLRGSRVSAFTLAGGVTAADESVAAARTCANIGARHFIARLSDTEIETWISDALGSMDQPTWDGINTFLVSKAARRDGLVAVLGGTGADELHGAYGYAKKLGRFIVGVRALGPLRKPVGCAARLAAMMCGRAVYGDRLQLMFAAVPHASEMVAEKRRFLTPAQIRAFWPGVGAHLNRKAHAAGISMASRDQSDQITVAEVEGYLRNTLLRDSDWATMANHQELRVPFLGRKYVELMLGLPWTVKVRPAGPAKPLLADLLSPPNRELAFKRKRGFTLDYVRMLLGSMAGTFRSACDQLNDHAGFSLESELLLTDLKQSHSQKYASRLWALLALGHYLGNHRKSLANNVI